MTRDTANAVLVELTPVLDISDIDGLRAHLENLSSQHNVCTISSKQDVYSNMNYAVLSRRDKATKRQAELSVIRLLVIVTIV